jgi:hypothetical protein
LRYVDLDELQVKDMKPSVLKRDMKPSNRKQADDKDVQLILTLEYHITNFQINGKDVPWIQLRFISNYFIKQMKHITRLVVPQTFL